MMKTVRILYAVFLWAALLGGALPIPVQAMGKGDDAPRMTKDDLRSLMEKGEVIVLDVRVGDEWKGSKEKIKGAIRENPESGVKSWAEKYPKDKTIVTYCT